MRKESSIILNEMSLKILEIGKISHIATSGLTPFFLERILEKKFILFGNIILSTIISK